MCFHNAYNMLPDHSKVDYMRDWFKVQIKPYYTVEDLLARNFIPTCSVVLRNGLIKEFPREFYQIPSPDWLLHIMMTQAGKLGFISEKWSVRRMHEGGAMSAAPRQDKLGMNIECLDVIDSYLGSRYEEIIKTQMSLYYYELAVGYAMRGDTANARGCAKKCILGLRYGGRLPYVRLSSLLLMVCSPSFYNLLGLLRQVIRKRLSY